jgi:two-component system, NtrC family, sensor kinase
MLLQPIISLVILGHLRKSLKSSPVKPKWDTLFKVGVGICIALIVLSVTLKDTRLIANWAGHIFIIALIYLVFYQKEFWFEKPTVFAVLPVLAVYLIEDIVRFFNPAFHKAWGNYFDAAGIFGFIWLLAMIIINNKQRKALEKERLKNEEKEKEFKITETLKAALEVQVTERTAELIQQKESLLQTLDELKATQSQLIQSEKMASLGELTAGIAHEIQNPLNFVNNFSEINTELIAEMKEAISKGDFEEVKTLANDIADNEQKINHHGKRADGIVKGMLQHSRSSSGVKEPTNINALADEYLRLAYHGLRAKDKSFNASMKTNFDDTIGNINIIPQDMGRVILNLITNAFYAVAEKKNLQQAQGDSYEPTVTVSTKKMVDKVEITVADNGNGIPQKVLDKIFQPFFTTKPTGQGTGLGLSMSYDIVTKGHGGQLKVNTTEGAGAQFIITIPV